MAKKTRTISVKYMRETDISVRLRYQGGMIWFPKKVIKDWDDTEWYYYNEPLKLEVYEWFLKKMGG